MIRKDRVIATFAGVPLGAVLAAVVLLASAGCAVTRGQETVGSYVDDSAITTSIKASTTSMITVSFRLVTCTLVL